MWALTMIDVTRGAGGGVVRVSPAGASRLVHSAPRGLAGLARSGPRAGPGGQGEGMLIEHRGAAPDVHPSAYVAPTAVLCGAVRVGPEVRILFGAVLTAEDGEIEVGAHCVVMENAVLRGRARHPSWWATTS